jgi:hypothetical protein
MKQGAGEGGEVENLLALVQSFDLDGAEGDSLGAWVAFVEPVEGGDDFDQMVAAANEDGDLPRFREFAS